MRFPDFALRVSQNVRIARERAELTQAELAQQGRLNLRHYQRLEAGQHVPTLEILFRVACALRTTVAALVEIPAEEWATAELPEPAPRRRPRRRRVERTPKGA